MTLRESLKLPAILAASNASLCNTKFCLPSPPPTEAEESSMELGLRAFGIGYANDPSNMKVVILSRSRAQEGMCSVCYNLLTAAWSPISYTVKPIYISTVAGSFVGKTESFHWMAYDVFHTYSVLTLNLNSMVFSEIAFNTGFPIQTLGTIDGNLCALMFMASVPLGVLEEDSWSNDREGVYRVQILESDHSWKKIMDMESFIDKQFGEFYILTFLDRGGILLRTLNKKTQKHSLVVCDLTQRLSFEVETPTPFHVGSTHAAEYIEAVPDLKCFGTPKKVGSLPRFLRPGEMAVEVSLIKCFTM